MTDGNNVFMGTTFLLVLAAADWQIQLANPVGSNRKIFIDQVVISEQSGHLTQITLNSGIAATTVANWRSCKDGGTAGLGLIKTQGAAPVGGNATHLLMMPNATPVVITPNFPWEITAGGTFTIGDAVAPGANSLITVCFLGREFAV